MWPLLLDLTKDECKRMLRRLELEAYSSIVSAFRAQGDLTKDKKKLLQDLTSQLGISTERHRAEIRRAVNDEKLATIADQIAGSSIASEWAIEGRRLVPLMPRLVPQTAFTSIANNAANVAAAHNACLPLPKDTSTKHAENIPVSQGSAETSVSRSVITTKAGGGCVAQMQVKQSTSQGVQAQPTQIQYETQMLKSGSVSNVTEDIQNSHSVPSAQMLVSAAVQTPEPPAMNNSNNVVMLPGGMSIHLKATNQDNSLECDKGRRRKRSPSADLSPSVGKTNTSVPLTSVSGLSSTVAKLSGASQRTVSIPIGGTPVQFTFTGTGQKAGTTSSTGSANATSQKVILVSSSCASSLPSSILQRSLGVPVVKTVAATGSTVSLTHPHSKSASLIAPSMSSNAVSVTPSANAPETTVQSSFNSSTSVSPTTNKTLSIATQPANASLSQIPLAARQAVKQGILVPVCTQASSDIASATQTIQLKPGAVIGKPSAFHIKDGSGLKIIAQTVPFTGGAKILPKPTGHTTSIPPILVVKKNASVPTAFHPNARVLNVITTQASTGKVITSSPLSASKSGAAPALVTVGTKGKQAAVVKVSPSMALTTAGGKSNVFVVQKTHMIPSSQSGGTIAVTSAPLSSVSRSISTSPSAGMAVQVGKGSVQMEHKSTVLADILQAAGILPEMTQEGQSSESSEHTASSTVENKGIIQGNFTSDISSDTSVTVEEWVSVDDEAKMSQLSLCTEPQSRSSSKRSPSVRIQQINLPFELQEGQVLEIQDASTLVTQPHKISTETLDILRRAGFDFSCDLTACTNPPDMQDDSSGVNIVKEEISETVNIQEAQTEEVSKDASKVSELSNQALASSIASVSKPLAAVKLEVCREEIISESTEESGELDPQTGIFYPYSRTHKTKTVTDDCSEVDKEAQVEQNDDAQQCSSGMWIVDNANTPEQVVECFPQQFSDKNQAEVIMQSSKSESSIEANSTCGDVALTTEDSTKFSDKCKSLDGIASVASTSEHRDLCAVSENNISEKLSAVEICNSESVEVKIKDDVEIPSSQCDSRKMLYCGATYSKENGFSRHRNLQNDLVLSDLETKDDHQLAVDDSSVNLLASSVPVCAVEESVDVLSEDVVHEVLECEEVPFTDCGVTSGAEETVVTTEEKDHCIVVECSDDIAAEIVTTSQNSASEEVLVAQTQKSETVQPDVVHNSPCVDQPSVSISSQVSIKDVISNSESQSSGSSIFMVTDSVVASDSSNIPLVVPVTEDNDSRDHLGLTDNNKIPVAEVTVHDDGSASYVVGRQDDREMNYGEEIGTIVYQTSDQSADTSSPSVATGSTKLPGKRKRKSSFGVISVMEETLNVPHLSGWARSAMGLLLRVMKFRGSRRAKSGLGASHWFLQPVTNEEAPGYHQIIKSPMDFSTVKKKLETFHYKNISEFNQDMVLIKSNCEMYNPPDHEARLDCDEVFTFYKQEYDRLIEKWQKTHLLSPLQKKAKSGP